MAIPACSRFPSNSSALVVAEAMGDESYQVKQDEAVAVQGRPHSGSDARAPELRMSCACAGAGCESALRRLPLPAKLPPTSGAALAAAMDESAPVDAGHSPLDGSSLRLSRRWCAARHDGRGRSPEAGQHAARVAAARRCCRRARKRRPSRKNQTVAANSAEEKRGVFSKIGAFFASIFH